MDASMRTTGTIDAAGMTAALDRRGFADPVFEAQAVFRAVMNAMARPGSIQALPVAAEAPPPLQPAAAAIALSLLDSETRVWLDPGLATVQEVGAWLRFHTGTTLTTAPGEAGFALISDPAHLPPLGAFAQGEEDYPDRSATLILQLAGLDGGPALLLTGPGLAAPARIAPHPVPADLAERCRANRARFPLGVDILLVAGAELAALPRSVRVSAPPGGEG